MKRKWQEDIMEVSAGRNGWNSRKQKGHCSMEYRNRIHLILVSWIDCDPFDLNTLFWPLVNFYPISHYYICIYIFFVYITRIQDIHFVYTLDTFCLYSLNKNISGHFTS